MEVDYKQKYLKYKEKYLKLKAQLGGAMGKCKDCTCGAFVSQAWINVTGPAYTSDDKNRVYTNLEKNNPNCGRQDCQHPFNKHH